MRNNQHKLSFFVTAAHLSDALEALDLVHTAASEHTLDTLNATGQAELISWLREIAFIANETIAELDKQPGAPELRVIKGGSCGDNDDPDGPSGAKELEAFRVLVSAESTSLLLYTKQAGG